MANWLSRLFRPEQYARQAAQRQVMVNLLDMWERNRPLADVWDTKAFVDDGYRRNTLVFSCIAKISTAYSQPPMMAWARNSQGDEVDLPGGHALVSLLNNPSGQPVQGWGAQQSRSEYLRTKAVHIETCGNSYTLKVRARGSRLPIALKLLRPDVVFPIADSRGELAAWSYGKQAASGTYSDAQLAAGVEDPTGQCQIIPARDIIHEIAMPDPLEPFRGLSPIAVLARHGDIDNFAGDYLRAFFLNAGIPSAILKYEDIVGDTERRAARERWRTNYGNGRWHDLGILDGGVDYQEIGSKVNTLDLTSVFGQTETRICMTLGVPPALIGAWIGLWRATFSNYDSARQSFYQETMQPKWTAGSDRMTLDLAKEFGDYLEVGFDLDQVDALQEDKQAARDFAVRAWDSDLLTENECREIIGANALPDAEGKRYKSDKTRAQEPEGSDGMLPDAAAMGAMPITARQRLLAVGERFEARPPAWRVLHGLADAAAEPVKKNS